MPPVPFAVHAPVQGFYFSFMHDWRTLEYRAAHEGFAEGSVPPVGEEPGTILSAIFREGNGEGDGAGFTVAGRSLSVGDVVHIAGCGAWLCDSVGWTRIPPEHEQRFPAPTG